MADDVTSRHLRSGTELQLLVPVRDGLVEGAERNVLLSRRLKLLLEALTEGVRTPWELQRLLPSGPIDQLNGIISTIWSVHEHARGAQLTVASCFDRSWEEYFHILVDRTGPLLDAIFIHCEGFENRTCKHGYEAFASFIRANQLRSSFFFMAAPDLTVDDLRRARRLMGAGITTEAAIGSVSDEKNLHLEQRLVEEPGLGQRLLDALPGSMQKLFLLRGLFPESEQYPGVTATGGAAPQPRNAQRIFDEAVVNLLSEFMKDPRRLPRPAGLEKWVDTLESIYTERATASRKIVDDKSYVVLTDGDLKNIQGNILESYAPERTDVTHGAAVLVQCDGASAIRALLTRIRARGVSTAELAPSPGLARSGYLNVAFTNVGLRRILPANVYASLPKEFREGMASRTGLMGDIGLPDHGELWSQPTLNWPDPATGKCSGEQVALSSVDLVITWQRLVDGPGVTSYDAPWSAAHPLCSDLRALNIEATDAHILHVQCLRRWPVSHFKLMEREKTSQPVPRVQLERTPGVLVDLTNGVPERDRVPLGELLLGYRDIRGEVSKAASEFPGYFRSGSFLVMRKLEQNVGNFEAYTKNARSPFNSNEDAVKKWMVGRDNVVPTQTNDYDFVGDPLGKQCPLHSHIRRCNPRTPATTDSTGSDIVPRIARRSFQFGPELAATGERGLLFMAYNASIAGQFEVVRRWINGGNSTGLPSTQNDLLTGVPQPTHGIHKVWTGTKWEELDAPTAPLVHLRWGLYLFVPSVEGIDELRKETPTPEASAAIAAGKAVIAELNALPSSQAPVAWKHLIEGDATPEKTALVWRAVRDAKEPVFAQGYGALVADPEIAQAVLRDDGKSFSVREYYRRLTTGFGPHYLAYDPKVGGASGDQALDALFSSQVTEGTYWARSAGPNELIASLSDRPIYEQAFNFTLEEVVADRPFLLTDLIKRALTKLGHAFAGIPGSDLPAKMALLERIIIISRYAFQPYPDNALSEKAAACKDVLGRAYRERQEALPMLDALKSGGASEEEANLATIGALVGFAAPALACVFNAFSYLMVTGEFQRVQVRLDAAKSPAASKRIVQTELENALLRVPAPPILYRTALSSNPFGLEAGTKVIVGLSQVAQALGSTAWLFGGPHGDRGQPVGPHHGCPARSPALAMMSGILDVLLRLPNLRAQSAVQFTCSGRLPNML